VIPMGTQTFDLSDLSDFFDFSDFLDLSDFFDLLDLLYTCPRGDFHAHPQLDWQSMPYDSEGHHSKSMSFTPLEVKCEFCA
jgi:hypothetical protein